MRVQAILDFRDDYTGPARPSETVLVVLGYRPLLELVASHLSLRECTRLARVCRATRAIGGRASVLGSYRWLYQSLQRTTVDDRAMHPEYKRNQQKQEEVGRSARVKKRSRARFKRQLHRRNDVSKAKPASIASLDCWDTVSLVVAAMRAHQWTSTYWLLDKLRAKARDDTYNVAVGFGLDDRFGSQDVGLGMAVVGESRDCLRVLDRLFTDRSGVFNLSIAEGKWIMGCVRHECWALLEWLRSRLIAHSGERSPDAPDCSICKTPWFKPACMWRWGDGVGPGAELVAFAQQCKWWLDRRPQVAVAKAKGSWPTAWAQVQESCAVCRRPDSSFGDRGGTPSCDPKCMRRLLDL